MSDIDNSTEKKYRVIGRRKNGDTVQVEDGVTFERAKQVRAALTETFDSIAIEEVVTSTARNADPQQGSDTRTEI
jgi:hypothetical protein